jgi:DNA polymerase-3 subunit epsilon
MTRGQDSLLMDLQQQKTVDIQAVSTMHEVVVKVLSADADELEAHQAYIEGLKKAGATAW